MKLPPITNKPRVLIFVTSSSNIPAQYWPRSSHTDSCSSSQTALPVKLRYKTCSRIRQTTSERVSNQQ